MKKCFSLSFIARIIVGTVFIYAGVNKIMDPGSFEKFLHDNGFLSGSFLGLITRIFPWMLLILGALMISGYLARYVASTISIFLLIIIIMNILSVSKGNCQACGIFSELVFYKRGNPFILLTINYLLLTLSGTVAMDKIFSPNKARFSFRRQVVFPLSIFFTFFLILTLFTFIGRRSYEGKYISVASGARNQTLRELKNQSLIGTDIKTISNIELPINADTRFIVMLTLHSLECGSCADEAAFLEYLDAKYGRKISFCAVVRKIGKTAIDNFKTNFLITYPFIEDPSLLDFKIFSKYKSLLTIISKDRKIMRIDPVSFNVKKFKDEYENVLLSYLK
jgi:putative oxidoreductase